MASHNMCENHSKLGQDPTPLSQPCLIRPSSSKGRSCALKAFPISPPESRGGLSSPRSPSSCIIPTPMAPTELDGTHRPPCPCPGAPCGVTGELPSTIPVATHLGAKHRQGVWPSAFLRAVCSGQQGTKHQDKRRHQQFWLSGEVFCSAQCPLGFPFSRIGEGGSLLK